MDLHALKENERKYAYLPSYQIGLSTAFIGYLRADMGSNGDEFYSSWFDFAPSLKMQDFKGELDCVINELREDNNIFSNRKALAKYCRSTYDASFGNERDYGIRINTDKYTYLIRLNPHRGEYNIYCYCYVKVWFDKHINNTMNGIRFVGANYRDLFKISDGDRICLTMNNGAKTTMSCRYIDDCHTEIGDSIYHIHQFAELMEKNKTIISPIVD